MFQVMRRIARGSSVSDAFATWARGGQSTSVQRNNRTSTAPSGRSVSARGSTVIEKHDDRNGSRKRSAGNRIAPLTRDVMSFRAYHRNRRVDWLPDQGFYEDCQVLLSQPSEWPNN